MASSDKTPVETGKADERKVRPNCTRCQGSSYSYERHAIAGIEGLLVFCSQCGGIFSWSPKAG